MIFTRSDSSVSYNSSVGLVLSAASKVHQGKAGGPDTERPGYDGSETAERRAYMERVRDTAVPCLCAEGATEQSPEPTARSAATLWDRADTVHREMTSIEEACPRRDDDAFSKMKARVARRPGDDRREEKEEPGDGARGRGRDLSTWE